MLICLILTLYHMYPDYNFRGNPKKTSKYPYTINLDQSKHWALSCTSSCYKGGGIRSLDDSTTYGFAFVDCDAFEFWG
ncbi:hypothetical protein Lser_V15G36958 [Lactuca serriola]